MNQITYTKEDLKFWTTASDCDSEILYVQYLTGASDKKLLKGLKNLIEIENRIASIEL